MTVISAQVRLYVINVTYPGYIILLQENKYMNRYLKLQLWLYKCNVDWDLTRDEGASFPAPNRVCKRVLQM